MRALQKHANKLVLAAPSCPCTGSHSTASCASACHPDPAPRPPVCSAGTQQYVDLKAGEQQGCKLFLGIVAQAPLPDAWVMVTFGYAQRSDLTHRTVQAARSLVHGLSTEAACQDVLRENLLLVALLVDPERVAHLHLSDGGDGGEDAPWRGQQEWDTAADTESDDASVDSDRDPSDDNSAWRGGSAEEARTNIWYSRHMHQVRSK